MEKEIILAIDIGGTSVKMGAVKEDVLLEKSSYRNIWKGNQDKLVEDLKLEYNKARQTSITQEITEVVSGANAVK